MDLLKHAFEDWLTLPLQAKERSLWPSKSNSHIKYYFGAKLFFLVVLDSVTLLQLILELGPYIEELTKTKGAIKEFVNPK